MIAFVKIKGDILESSLHKISLKVPIELVELVGWALPLFCKDAQILVQCPPYPDSLRTFNSALLTLLSACRVGIAVIL
jgi:hypothetical protein